MSANKEKKKKTGARLFVNTLLTTLGVFLGVFIIAAAGFSFLSDNVHGEGHQAGADGGRAVGSSEPRSSGFLPVFNMPRREPPRRSFALIMGVDDTRTDTMMVAGFNPENSEVTLISLPRDSRVIMPPDRVAEIRGAGGWAPSDGVMKLNEVHHYALLADSSWGPRFLKLQVEELLGIELDYYVRIDLEAFEFLVDEMGGVYFNVPVRMFYHDPCQNLMINLHPGPQMLNGYNALNMVRFRNYPAGYMGGDDFARMQTQQDFLRAFVGQAMNVETIMSNLPAFATAAFRYVDTNFGISDIPRYLRYINSFNPDNISTHTLPHNHTRVINGVDFVILNEVGIREMVDDLLLGLVEVVEQTSEDLRIQVLNGSNVSGLARNARELFEMNGLEVEAIGDYQGMRTDNNRIFVSRRGMGGDIQEILKNSTIIYNPNLDPRFDIVVVIGRLGLD